jgi:hypothetical protein
MQIKKNEAKVGDWKVEIIESERGWGSKVDEVLYFTEQAEAATYVKEYNEKYNPPGPVPDWYMVAQGPYQVG